MFGRLLRVTCTVLVIAIACVTPVLATSAPASGDTVVDGCTIVSNPTATNFTNCPGADLGGANLSGVDLSFANLAGAEFVDCSGPAGGCAAADLTGANFTSANLSHAGFVNCPPPSGGDCTDAPLSEANFTDANLSPDGFVICPISGFDLAKNGNCVATPLNGAVFTGANLTNGSLASCSLNDFGSPFCAAASLSGDDLSAANLSGVNFGNCAIGIGDGQGIQSCAGAGLTSANLTGVTLTGANLTATSLVPLDQTATATSSAGAVVTWPTPPSVPGATPGSCSPASGSTFPIGDFLAGTGTTVTCQVLDDQGGVATGTFGVTVYPPSTTTTFVGIPSNGATITGTTWLDAGASSPVGITSVNFELSGGPFTDQVISGSTPTIYGYIGAWNSTSVPNGTYTLQSVATDTLGQSTTSATITITVDNPPPSTSVVSPLNGATLSGTTAVLDAGATADVTSVSYELSGGTLSDQVIATATPTIYGWLAVWDTTGVSNGTYTLQSVGTYSGGTVTSAPITVTVSN